MYFPPAATLEHKRRFLSNASERIRELKNEIKALEDDVAELEKQ
jgi:hypothetical protein